MMLCKELHDAEDAENSRHREVCQIRSIFSPLLYQVVQDSAALC
jgi:hypothetical protein